MRENITRNIIAFVFISLPMLTLPHLSAGALVDVIKNDLAPLSGYVVMSTKSQLLVDLDAHSGLKIGDLLSVIRPGEKITHPVSKETLGYLEEIQSILKVTRIKDGYSHTRQIGKKSEIKKGDIVKRFFNLSAAYVGSDSQFYDRLSFALPELLWQGQFKPGSDLPKVDLTFAAADNRVDLIDTLGNRIRSFSIHPDQKTSDTNASTLPAETALKPDITKGSDDIEFGSYTNLGELPDRVRMSAFFNSSKKLLMATVDGKILRVLDVSGKIISLASTQISHGMAEPLTVHWWQPDNQSPIYLVVSASFEDERNSGLQVETRLAGSIFEWRDNKLIPVAKNLRWFMGSYDRDGDGVPETLLGQEFDYDLVFSRVFALQLKANSIKKSAVPFELPRGFVVPGSIMADLNGNGKVEIVTVHNGILSIFSGRERIYQSSQGMGGSLATLTYDVNAGAIDLMHRTIAFDVPPAVADLNNGGGLKIFTPASDGSMFKVGIGPAITKSWVAVIKSQNGVFKKGKLPGDLENPLQGIWAGPKRLLIVETRDGSTLFSEGKSYLLQFEFSQK